MFERRREEELRVWAYLLSPAAIHTMDSLQHYGKSAARAIAEAQAMIAKLEAYQMQLYDRAQQIAAAPWHTELLLQRERCFDTIRYYLDIRRVYDAPGIDPETLERTTYPGKERSKALKAYRDYIKTHPGIVANMDIERRQWER